MALPAEAALPLEAPAGPAAAALAAECEVGLSLFGGDVRRKHMHFTHVRTHNPDHRQPSSFTREQFWEHMETCYKEAYPSQDGQSILAFGMVVKEKHQVSQDGYREEHHHCAVFCTTPHFWSKVARLSLSKGVPLNAVAHDGYVTMYEYLRQPSARKPLSELDAEPYLSSQHPRGADLAGLLEAGRKAARGHQGRRAGNPAQQKRERAPKLYDIISQNKVNSGVEMRELAHAEAKAGRPALAEWCTRQGHKVDQVVANAKAVLDAPEAAARSRLTRMDKLRAGAENLLCTCEGKWAGGAIKILDGNGIPPNAFCRSVLRALELGARRTCNIACVGKGGCGKSSLLEPLQAVFETAAKPQKGSTFPLSRVPQADILLWQDYHHDEGTIAFCDLLALLVGEGLDIRMPGQLNVKCRNEAPMFMSGRTELQPANKFSEKGEQLFKMMSDRFTVFNFTKPLIGQDAKWPQCGRCAASFFLARGTAEAGLPVQVSLQPATPSTSTLPQQLLQLGSLKRDGVLNEKEFQAAKRRCLADFGAR